MEMRQDVDERVGETQGKQTCQSSRFGSLEAEAQWRAWSINCGIISDYPTIIFQQSETGTGEWRRPIKAPKLLTWPQNLQHSGEGKGNARHKAVVVIAREGKQSSVASWTSQ
jgi:hypothetical protein